MANNLKMPPKVMLAPLTPYTDATFRILCSELGAQYTFTEFVSTRTFKKEQLSKEPPPRDALRIDIRPQEKCGVQLRCYGVEDTTFTIKSILSGQFRGKTSNGVPMSIDLNMGGPYPGITNVYEGSYFLKDIKKSELVISQARKVCTVPLSVKIRTGWDGDTINVTEFCKMAESCGIDWITVHGRTSEDMYKPGTNSLDNIRKAKESVSIPVIGNGDIFNGQDAKRMFDYCGVDGVMVARGAIGNPFIFEDIQNTLNGKPSGTPQAFKYINCLSFAIVLINSQPLGPRSPASPR